MLGRAGPGPQVRYRRDVRRRRFCIVTEDTRFEARLRPGPPGTIHLSGVAGEFTAVEGEDGLFDLSHPVEGTFGLEVGRLDLGHRVLTRAARIAMGDDPIVGRLGAADARDDGSYRMELFLTLRGAEHRLEGTGRVDPPADGRSVLHGTMVVKPQDIGMPVPGFLSPVVVFDFAIVLALIDR